MECRLELPVTAKQAGKGEWGGGGVHVLMPT